jgi:hypothetical protein
MTMGLISLIARENLARMNAIVVSGMLREHRVIRYRNPRGENKGPKRSAESQRQGQEQRQGCFNSLTTMVADMRPLFFELRDRLITFLLFVR